MSNQDNEHALVSTTFMPALTPAEADHRYKAMVTFVKDQMVLDKDYGQIEGTNKPTLYKPGAEKLNTLFGYSVRFVDEATVERWDDDDPFFYYRRRCELWRGEIMVASASGSCNSKEGRYRWRWVSEDQVPDILDKSKLKVKASSDGVFGWQYEKRETAGKYGKPESYWQQFDQAIANGTVKRYNKVQPWNNKQEVFLEIGSVAYRVPNEDIFSLVNTVLKIADKRALIAATLIGCNASEFFTQDMEDLAGIDPDKEDIVDASFTESTPKEPVSVPVPPEAVAKAKAAKAKAGVVVEGTSTVITPREKVVVPVSKKVEAESDAETAIANFTAAAKEGTVGGNDYLNLGKSLGYDSAFVMEVKGDFTTETKDDKGKKVTKTDFSAAGEFLIARYREINGEPAAA